MVYSRDLISQIIKRGNIYEITTFNKVVTVQQKPRYYKIVT